MLPPSFDISRPYRANLLSQSPSAALKRPRAASAPCETEEARQRKRSRGIAFMNENILEEVVGEETRDVKVITRRSKGKEKESPSPAAHSVLGGGVTAAVIEELAQVCTRFSCLACFSIINQFIFKELKCGCCTELCYNVRVLHATSSYTLIHLISLSACYSQPLSALFLRKVCLALASSTCQPIHHSFSAAVYCGFACVSFSVHDHPVIYSKSVTEWRHKLSSLSWRIYLCIAVSRAPVHDRSPSAVGSLQG
jgi:hypothetical protein